MARYPRAQWKGPVPGVGGSLGPVSMGVVHIMEGYLNGTDAWFHNPASKVSAHFGIGKDGTVYQWVDTGQVAWHAASYNGSSIGVEHEGFTGDQLTGQQMDQLALLMDWLGFPLRNGNPGWMGHGQLGAAGGSHPACPGQPILNQLPAIFDLASGGPPPPPPPKGSDMISATSTGNGYWCVTHDGAVYAYGDARNVGQPFGSSGGDRLQPGVTIVGIAGHGTAGYWLYASDGSVFAYGSAPFLGRPDRF